MKKNNTSLVILSVTLAAMMTFSSCSSSGVDGSANAPTEELPVIDAETDQVPPPAADANAAVVDPTSGAIAGTTVPSDTATLPAESSPPPAETTAAVDTALPPAADSTTAPPSMDSTPPPATVADANPTTPPAAAVESPTPSGSEVAATEYNGPLDTTSETHSSGGSNPTGNYTVKKGDTLMKIAYKVHGDIFRWKEILENNKDFIQNANDLKVGSTLKVDGDAQEMSYEGYERYAIKTGDTLGTISHDIYGTKKRWKKLWKMNSKLIKDPNRIYAGFYLRYKFSEKDQHNKENMGAEAAPLAGTESQPAPAEQSTTAEGPGYVEERNPSSTTGAQPSQNMKR